MRNLPEKKGYAKHLAQLGEDLYGLEHFKGDKCNVAVAILQNGQYFVGTAFLNPVDQYNHKLGHEIAVGRALFRAVYCINNDGILWEEGAEVPTGRELGKLCQKIAQDALEEAMEYYCRECS